jgi:hypothetical protein
MSPIRRGRTITAASNHRSNDNCKKNNPHHPPQGAPRLLYLSQCPPPTTPAPYPAASNSKAAPKTPASKRRARRAKPPRTKHPNPAHHKPTQQSQKPATAKPTSPSQPHPPLATRRPATSNRAVQAQVQARRKRSVDMRRLSGRG